MPQVGIAGNCQNVYGSQVWANWFALGPTARNLKTWWNLEDFIAGATSANKSGIWLSTNGGAGSFFADGAGTAVRPGIMTGSTGTTNTGYATLYVSQAGYAGFLFGAGVYTFETEIYITTLSAVAEEYIIRIGFGDVITGADMVDGAYFEYNRLTSVNWYCCTSANSARTKADSGVAAGAAAWIRLKIVVNDDATAAAFYINDVLVRTNILNIPSGAGRNTAAIFNIIKSAGTTGRTLQVDWAWLHFDLTVSR